MNDHRQPPADERPQLSVTISLHELYKSLCPDCQARLLDYLTKKASAGQLREGLRKQLEAPARPEPVEGVPDVDH